MKCNNCKALCIEGYEYPEEYCSIETLAEPSMTDDGCGLHYKTIEKAVKENEEAWIQCHSMY